MSQKSAARLLTLASQGFAGAARRARRIHSARAACEAGTGFFSFEACHQTAGRDHHDQPADTGWTLSSR